MEISHQINDDCFVLSLKGDLIGEQDGAQILEVVNDAQNAKVMVILISLEDVRYMNSSGLGVLITLLTKVKNKGGELALMSVSDQILKLLQMTKLDAVFKIYKDQEEAFKTLNS